MSRVGFDVTTSSSSAVLSDNRTHGKADFSSLGSTISAVHLVLANQYVTYGAVIGRTLTVPNNGTVELGLYVTDITGVTTGALVCRGIFCSSISGTVTWCASPDVLISLSGFVGQYVKVSRGPSANFRCGQVTGISGDVKSFGGDFPNPAGSTANQALVIPMYINIETMAAAILTMTSPLVIGGSFTATLAGYIDGVATLSGGGISQAVTITSNAISDVLIDFADGLLLPFLPASSVSMTITQGATSASIVRDISPPDGYISTLDVNDDPANFVDVDSSNPMALGKSFADAGNPLLDGDRAYHLSAGGRRINQDSSIAYPLVTNEIIYIHRAIDGKIYQHLLTVTPDGIIIDNGGISVAGLSVAGLSVVGLSITGL